MKSTNITQSLLSFVVVILMLSCSSKKAEFATSLTLTLDSVDMIEFKKGDSSNRFVNPEHIKTIKKLLQPGELAESQSGVAECPIQIILYKNSEIVGEIGVRKETGLIYSVNNQAMQAAPKEELNSFIEEIQF
jgi:hypothetical protein